MTPTQIAADIARGIEIKDEIAKLEAELDQIEKRLESAGLAGPHIPLQEAEREGKQFLAHGSSKIVPIRFESDQIVGSFSPDSTMHLAVAAAAGDKLARFYKDVRKFERVPKDGNAFRKLARKLLEPAQYAALITACISRDKTGIPKSKTVIAWDDAKPISHVANA